MNLLHANQDIFLTTFGEIASDLPGGDQAWLYNIRQAAIAHYDEIGLPHKHDEDWKYTRVDHLKDQSFTFDSAGADLNREAIKPYLPNFDCHLVVFINGLFAPHLSQIAHLPQGILLSNLAQMFYEHPEMVQPLLARADTIPAHGFALLNTAFMTDGLFLQVPNNTQVQKPIYLLHLNNRAQHNQNYRHLIVLEPHARVQIIEAYHSTESGSYTNAITQVTADVDAFCDHTKLIHEHTEATHISSVNVEQAMQSTCNSHAFTFSGGLVRADTNIHFCGEDAQAKLIGLYCMAGKQHVDHHTSVEHSVGKCCSQQLYKGILADKARAVFNGKVIVAQNAGQTIAHQKNKNILLSSEAEVDTKPQLEIFADDVQCNHGATVGQIDSNALFYLQSRGVPKAQAMQLLIRGFAQEVLQTLEEPAALQNHIERHIEQMLD